ncbi:MAG: hypothetical protein ACLPTZ_10830, partial [Beijerinckiaceae bacterium]
MVAIADAPRLRMRENRLIDGPGTGLSLRFWILRLMNKIHWRFRTTLRGRQSFGQMDGKAFK